MPGIVVGHDGSNHARAAVEKAADLATALDETLVVVRVFGLRHSAWPEDLPFGSVPTADELEAHARRGLDADLAPVREARPGLDIEARVLEGRPVKVLAQAGKGARLLVVASRGLGGFDRLLLGSVSDQLVRYADCDVLVIRH